MSTGQPGYLYTHKDSQSQSAPKLLNNNMYKSVS